jgi:hypothetical protein
VHLRSGNIGTAGLIKKYWAIERDASQAEAEYGYAERRKENKRTGDEVSARSDAIHCYCFRFRRSLRRRGYPDCGFGA